MRFTLCTILALAAGAAGAAEVPAVEAVAAQQPEDREKLIQEIIRLRLELLELKLSLARSSKNTAEVIRLLTEEALGAPYEEVQVYGLTELGKLDDKPRETTVPNVLSKMQGFQPAATAVAIDFLSKAKHPEAVKAVFAAVNHPSAAVRLYAVRSLQRIGGVRALGNLHRRLEKEKELDVLLALVETLATFADQSSVEPLNKLWARATDAGLREKIIGAFGEIKAATAVEVLLTILKSKGPDSEMFAVIAGLGKISKKTDEKVKAAIRPYIDPSQPVMLQDIAAQALGQLGDSTVLPQLKAMLAHQEVRQRTAGFRAITLMIDDALLKESLLPAFAAEQDNATSAQMWRTLCDAIKDSFPRTAIVADFLVAKKNLSARMEEAAVLLAAFDEKVKKTPAYAEITMKIADDQAKSEQHRLALQKYRELAGLMDDANGVLLKAARCHVALKEYKPAWSDFERVIAKIESKGSARWWELNLEGIEALHKAADNPATLTACHPLLHSNPVPAPQEPATLQRIQQIYSEAAGAVLAGLDPAKPEETKPAVRMLGRLILLPLCDHILDPQQAARHPLLIEVANEITGDKKFEPKATAQDEAKRRQAVEFYRAWLNNTKSP